MEDKIRCAVFGYKDAFVGQIEWMLQQLENYDIEFYISISRLPNLDVEAEHLSRPNSKTEFVSNNEIFGKKILEEENFIPLLKNANIKYCFVLEDDRFLRKKIIDELTANDIEACSFIHPLTYIGGHNTFGAGVIIFPNCYIGYKSDVGDGTIIQSNCTIEHHNVVGHYVNINPKLTTGGFTKIDNFCEINMSVDIINKITVGENARIGAGSLVLENVKSNSLYYGRPSKFIRKNTPMYYK